MSTVGVFFRVEQKDSNLATQLVLVQVRLTVGSEAVTLLPTISYYPVQ
jgi:hypothetical protein